MEQTYRKGLTVGDVKGTEFKVYEKPKENNFVEKLIIQFKKSKMKNDYGIYTELLDGTEEWMVQEAPFELGSYEDAIDNLSFTEACTIANYFTNLIGDTFKVGRPNDRHPS